MVIDYSYHFLSRENKQMSILLQNVNFIYILSNNMNRIFHLSENKWSIANYPPEITLENGKGEPKNPVQEDDEMSNELREQHRIMSSMFWKFCGIFERSIQRFLNFICHAFLPYGMVFVLVSLVSEFLYQCSVIQWA